MEIDNAEPNKTLEVCEEKNQKEEEYISCRHGENWMKKTLI